MHRVLNAALVIVFLSCSAEPEATVTINPRVFAQGAVEKAVAAKPVPSKDAAMYAEANRLKREWTAYLTEAQSIKPDKDISTLYYLYSSVATRIPEAYGDLAELTHTLRTLPEGPTTLYILEKTTAASSLIAQWKEHPDRRLLPALTDLRAMYEASLKQAGFGPARRYRDIDMPPSGFRTDPFACGNERRDIEGMAETSLALQSSDRKMWQRHYADAVMTYPRCECAGKCWVSEKDLARAYELYLAIPDPSSGHEAASQLGKRLLLVYLEGEDDGFGHVSSQPRSRGLNEARLWLARGGHSSEWVTTFIRTALLKEAREAETAKAIRLAAGFYDDAGDTRNAERLRTR